MRGHDGTRGAKQKRRKPARRKREEDRGALKGARERKPASHTVRAYGRPQNGERPLRENSVHHAVGAFAASCVIESARHTRLHQIRPERDVFH